MDAPGVIVFRLKDWPAARPVLEVRALPEAIEDVACFVHAPEHAARSTLEERLPEGPVEPPLADAVMELVDLVTEPLLECFGHELFGGGPVGRKHVGFHPSAPYAAVAQRFERDGFRVLHGAELSRSDLDLTAEREASRQRVRQVPKAGLSEREIALVEYVRSGGPMPQAGADHGAVALHLGRALTPRLEHLSEIDGRILDVACAAGELGGVFEAFAARVNAREERGQDTYGLLRRELAKRGLSEGRVLVATLRSGLEVVSSATLHVVARYGQLDALLEEVRSNVPSRTERVALATRLLAWMSCTATLRAALDAVVELVESGRAKDLVGDELKAHLQRAHGYEGPKARGGRKAKSRAAEAPAPQPQGEAGPPPDAGADEPKPRKARARAEKVPTLSSLNRTVAFTAEGDDLLVAEPAADVGDLVEALNQKLAVALRSDRARPLTVRLTGRGLTAQEADHAFGAHRWFGLKTEADTVVVFSGGEGVPVDLPRGQYTVEVVAVRAPKGSGAPDYVLLVRDEPPTKTPSYAEVPLVPTR